MVDLRPQHYRRKFSEKADPELLNRVIETVAIINSDAHAILTLNHLAQSASVPWPVLRNWVLRRGGDPYFVFKIEKSNGRRRWKGDAPSYRTICHPSASLMRVQRFLAKHVLGKITPHHASTAFSKGSSLIKAVEPHLGCKWLIKIDVAGFFESVNEIGVYRVFRSVGYQPLVSFELSRLCTRRPGKLDILNNKKKWAIFKKENNGVYKNNYLTRNFTVLDGVYLQDSCDKKDEIWNSLLNEWGEVFPEISEAVNLERSESSKSMEKLRMGYLPQGAPTSPMISNLVFRELDERIAKLSRSHGLSYSRYADDMSFSTTDKNGMDRVRAKTFISDIYKILKSWGFAPNLSKTRVRGPGSRKILLGILIDTDKPRIPKSFYEKLRMHYYYINKFGPIQHAKNRKFRSSLQLRLHLEGLIHHVRFVDREKGNIWLNKHNSVPWPI